MKVFSPGCCYLHLLDRGEVFSQPGYAWFAWALPHTSAGARHPASSSCPSFRGSHSPVHIEARGALRIPAPVSHLWLFILSAKSSSCHTTSSGGFWVKGRGDGCGCDVPLSKQDEQSAVSMLKKHQILEQAVEDYAETVHQLSKTSRALVADSHPER